MSDIRVSESGVPWQRCPSCGLEVIPSANGWRTHVPFCNGVFQRYMTILAERALRPFERVPHEFGSRVLGEPLPLRWRVSRDEWYRLEREAMLRWGWSDLASGLPAHLFGWPIESDPSLPSGSIVLEPDEG